MLTELISQIPTEILYWLKIQDIKDLSLVCKDISRVCLENLQKSKKRYINRIGDYNILRCSYDEGVRELKRSRRDMVFIQSKTNSSGPITPSIHILLSYRLNSSIGILLKKNDGVIYNYVKVYVSENVPPERLRDKTVALAYNQVRIVEGFDIPNAFDKLVEKIVQM
jgi:hypothetical protein